MRRLYQHWFISLITASYFALLLSVIRWGIPNSEQVFLYHMDEWHQLMSIRALGEHFTTTVEGAAHGTVFHFLVSGAFLGMFQLLGVINIFEITSSVAHLQSQEKIFIILRLSTLLYGTGAVLGLYYILKYQLKLASYWVGVIFFVFTPIWLSLSNYFKYDIALTFWIVLTLALLFRFVEKPSYFNYLIAGVAAGLTFDTKISAVPLLILYVIAYFITVPNWSKKILTLINGVSVLLLTILLLGVPDLIIGKADYSIIFKDVVIDYPANSYNYVFGKHFWWYLLFDQFPTNFGRPLAILCILSFTTIIYIFYKKIIFHLPTHQSLRKLFLVDFNLEIKRISLMIIGFLLFAASLYPLKLFSSGNRMLVLLPFITIMVAYATNQLLLNKKRQSILLSVIAVAILFQIIESLTWVNIKWQPDPRQQSSIWIEQNIPNGQIIGITSPVIYEKIPDVLLKDYFFDLEESIEYQPTYQYVDVLESDTFPNLIILTDLQHEQFKFVSPKYQLYQQLLKLDYQPVAVFSPYFGIQKYSNHPISFAITNLVPTPLDITILANAAGRETINNQ